MSQTKIIVATKKDAVHIKQMINQMYGFEYETRTPDEIAQAIEKCHQVYVLAKQGDDIIGFAGATTNSTEYQKITTQTQTVIEYIYTIPSCRNFFVAFFLTQKLIEYLVQLQQTCAIMQVQTFNKQRFFHYALCDNNIINSTSCKTQSGKCYQDQILLINDLKSVIQQTPKQFMKKVQKHKN